MDENLTKLFPHMILALLEKVSRIEKLLLSKQVITSQELQKILSDEDFHEISEHFLESLKHVNPSLSS